MIPGFYWQTLETEDQKCQSAEATISQECHTEVKESFVNGIISFSEQFLILWLLFFSDSTCSDRQGTVS